MQGLNLPEFKQKGKKKRGGGGGCQKSKTDYKNKMNVLMSHSSEYKPKKH